MTDDRASDDTSTAIVETVEVPAWLVHRILAESIDQPLPRETWDALDALCCSPPRLVPFDGEVEGLDDGSSSLGSLGDR
ncbi:hypothetical protein NHL50_19285 [Acidimicrobiia bacterium EGI L10123]|uniref:hypothetical protein n=1 Tax=Salinilacustrithrix flava TaxID=2957203 RepID=UPI003D7C2D80|nr:hypothetical protein [Acidimicrobiia bacterium EGI L10123]